MKLEHKVWDSIPRQAGERDCGICVLAYAAMLPRDEARRLLKAVGWLKGGGVVPMHLIAALAEATKCPWSLWVGKWTLAEIMVEKRLRRRECLLVECCVEGAWQPAHWIVMENGHVRDPDPSEAWRLWRVRNAKEVVVRCRVTLEKIGVLPRFPFIAGKAKSRRLSTNILRKKRATPP